MKRETYTIQTGIYVDVWLDYGEYQALILKAVLCFNGCQEVELDITRADNQEMLHDILPAFCAFAHEMENENEFF